MTPIPRKQANEILKKIELRYSGPLVSPSIDSDYDYIEVFSNRLPILDPILAKEFELAERVGGQYGLKLTEHNFSPGEGGELTKYELVYVSTCKSLDELREAPETISKAIAELKKRTYKIN